MDKINNNGRGKRSENGRIKGVARQRKWSVKGRIITIAIAGLKEWQWQDKSNTNGRDKRSDNGRIRGVAVAEKEES
jgi:hypothetical protein